jgi:hypothetical protein
MKIVAYEGRAKPSDDDVCLNRLSVATRGLETLEPYLNDNDKNEIGCPYVHASQSVEDATPSS